MKACIEADCECVQVFLEGLKAAMQADIDFKAGWYDQQKPPVAGPRAFARVYAGWGFSQPFYWQEVSCILNSVTSPQHLNVFAGYTYLLSSPITSSKPATVLIKSGRLNDASCSRKEKTAHL